MQDVINSKWCSKWCKNGVVTNKNGVASQNLVKKTLILQAFEKNLVNFRKLLELFRKF